MEINIKCYIIELSFVLQENTARCVVKQEIAAEAIWNDYLKTVCHRMEVE